VESSIQKRKNLIEVLEPLSPEEEEAIHSVWGRPLSGDKAVPALTFYYASILHYLDGNRVKAITRTKDWVARLGPDDNAEKITAQAQLASLERVH
jgi:hypothetical protein